MALPTGTIVGDPGYRSLGDLGRDLNRLQTRERRFQRTALTAPVARGRLLGGRIRTVRGARQVTGVESDPPA